MRRVEELLEATKLNNFLRRRETKRKRKLGKVFIGIGIAAGILIIAFVVYRFLNSRGPEDFDDDFEDDFDDDFFEEEFLHEEDEDEDEDEDKEELEK